MSDWKATRLNSVGSGAVRIRGITVMETFPTYSMLDDGWCEVHSSNGTANVLINFVLVLYPPQA